MAGSRLFAGAQFFATKDNFRAKHSTLPLIEVSSAWQIMSLGYRRAATGS